MRIISILFLIINLNLILIQSLLETNSKRGYLSSLNKLNTPFQSLDSNKIDLCFSSAFLGFARHAGFYQALEDTGVSRFTGSCIGTSSGALAAAMVSSGFNAERLNNELSQQAPIKLMRLSGPRSIKQGLFTLDKLINHLKDIGIPQDFNDFKYPVSFGVIEPNGEFTLIDNGDAHAAIAASCAIPVVFRNVEAGLPPRKMYDGGVKERTGVDQWSKWNRSNERILVHLVKSSKEKLDDPATNSNIEIPSGKLLHAVKTPKTRANFWSLKNYEEQKAVAYSITMKQLYSSEFDNFISSSP